jgi:hypothetical protein
MNKDLPTGRVVRTSIFTNKNDEKVAIQKSSSGDVSEDRQMQVRILIFFDD